MFTEVAVSEEFVDQTIANLKVIGMLGQSSRLCVRHGRLSVERDDTLQPIRRWLARDSRELTLMHIRNTLNNALKIIRTLLPLFPALPLSATAPASAPVPSSASADHALEVRRWALCQLLTELRACEAGLQNLRTTYSDDTMTVAAIDVLTDRVRANCDALTPPLHHPHPTAPKVQDVGGDALHPSLGGQA